MVLDLQMDTWNQDEVSLYKNSCCGKGTFILDYIQTVLKEWNWTKREIWFLLPASPVNDTSFHLAHFFIGIFPPASSAELLWFGEWQFYWDQCLSGKVSFTSFKKCAAA